MTRNCMTSSSKDLSKCFDMDDGTVQGILTSFRALQAQDIAEAVLYMLSQPLNIFIKALDVVATGKSIAQFQRSHADNS